MSGAAFAALALASGPAAARISSTATDPAQTYLEARAAAMNGDHARSATLLASLASAEPNQPDIARKALAEAIGSGRMDLALTLAQKIAPAKLPIEARLLLAADALRHNRLDRAQTWLAVRVALVVPTEPAMFIGVHGRRLSPRSIERRLAAWAIKQGLGRHVHPHMLRHSFASHVLQSSGDLRAVQEMLGHASIASTQVYTHLDFQALAKVYDAAHPRARRKKRT